MSSHHPPLTAHAPGSLMLMGEHAVLHGVPALCMAVDRRMHLQLRRRQDRRFTLQSALGDFDGDLDDFEVCAPYTFILEALHRRPPPRGFDLTVTSEFSSTLGFGSSAAVTVAMVTLLRALSGQPFDRAAIFSEALATVRHLQGKASGSDLAAAVYGGVVHYRTEPLQVEPLHCRLPLTAVYAGYKTPTPEVIRLVEEKRQADPAGFAALFESMADCVAEAVRALRGGDLPMLGEGMQRHQELQAALGCSDETLDFLVAELRKKPGVLGSKISGSGRGDCVIALGTKTAVVPGYDSFPIETAFEGVTLDA